MKSIEFYGVLAAIGVAFVLGSCIGMSASVSTEAKQLDECRQQSLLKRCCACTTTELNHCGR